MQLHKISVIGSALLLLTTAYAAEPQSNPPSGGAPACAQPAAQETVKLAISGMT